MIRFLDRLVEQHKAVRRTLVVWAAMIITYVTHEIILVLRNMDEVTAPVVSFYLGVTALLTAVIGFYQWSRERDANDKSRRAEDPQAAGSAHAGAKCDRRPDVPTE